MHCRNSLQVSQQNNEGEKSEIFEFFLTSWDFGMLLPSECIGTTLQGGDIQGFLVTHFSSIPSTMQIQTFHASSVRPDALRMVQVTSHCSGAEISPISLKLFTVPRSHLCCAMPPICIIASCLPFPLSVFKIFISPLCGSLSRVPI